MGECSNCGECCILYKSPNHPINAPDYAPYPKYEYCGHFDSNAVQHCKIYSVRGKACREYPSTPFHTLNRARCGFSFVDEVGHKVDGYMDRNVFLIPNGKVYGEIPSAKRL